MGRTDELALIADVVDRARGGRGGVVLLEGEPGVGKSTLLEAVPGLAPDFQVLATRGIETEGVVPFAGLVQLLGPLRDLARLVPAGQAAALDRALGWSDSEGPADRFLVAAATLSLLAEAAQQQPVLLLVDDLMWLDAESAVALLFAARRVDRDRVAVITAARSGTAGGPADGVVVATLEGLDVEGAVQLLGDRVAETVARRLHRGTGGNPLALLETARHLSGPQRAGGADLPDPLPVASRVESVLDPVLEALSPSVREALLLTAVHPTGADHVVTAALAARGVDAASAIDEAVDRDVLRPVEGGGHGFRHPLLRSAVLRRASSREIREAHRVLAVADTRPDDPVALWHLASSVEEPDSGLADRLADLAVRTRERTGLSASARILERAAWLTPDPGLAAERRAAAAYDAFVAGDVDRSRRLADTVLGGDAPGEARGRAGFALGMLEQYAGAVPLAWELLDRAATDAGPDLRVKVLGELAVTSFRLGELDRFVDCAARIAEVADDTRADHRMWRDFTGGVSLVVQGQLERGIALLRATAAHVADVSADETPEALLVLALSAAFLGDPRPAFEAGVPLLAGLRQRGAVGVLVPALAIYASGRAWVGDHLGAFADAGEAVELGEHLGYVADVAVAQGTLAWELAARGRLQEAATALGRARQLTDRAGTTTVAAHLSLTDAFLALCREDPAGVVAVLEPRLALDGGVGAMGEPLGVAPLLVEAYAALGRVEDARHLAARLQEVTPASAAPPLRALALRARALVEDDDESAFAAFEAALAAHAEAPEAFEEARTTFLLGSRLRRAGSRVRARARLRVAGEAFAAMDLAGWVERVSTELAATGATRRRSGEASAASLTSQEARVAGLVAAGLTNREVAAALFLSPRTVEHHLSSVFRKRGLRSRADVVRLFASSGGHQDADGAAGGVSAGSINGGGTG